MVFIPIISSINQMFCFFLKSNYLPNNEFLLFVDVNGLGLTIVTRNTGRLNRNLHVMLKFTERPKTPGITSKKSWLSLKGINCLQVIFVLIWMKQTLTWFNLQRDGTGNGLSNVNLHQTKACASSRLVSQAHMM